MSDEALRRKNEEIIRRFLTVDFFSDERRDLWADDAVFEPALDRDGAVYRGKEAIHGRALDSAKRIRDFRISDIVIEPMLDPNRFLVTHAGEATSTSTGKRWRGRFASILQLRDGKVVHKIEFADPGHRD